MKTLKIASNTKIDGHLHINLQPPPQINLWSGIELTEFYLDLITELVNRLRKYEEVEVEECGRYRLFAPYKTVQFTPETKDFTPTTISTSDVTISRQTSEVQATSETHYENGIPQGE